MRFRVPIGQRTAAVIAGMVGAAGYDVAKKTITKAPLRDAAVSLTVFGLRGTRRAEEVAESVRLRVGDVVAEAKERVGEQQLPPVTEPHPHEH